MKSPDDSRSTASKTASPRKSRRKAAKITQSTSSPKQSPKASVGRAVGLLGLFDSVLRSRESFFEEIFAGRDLMPLFKRFLLAIFLLCAFYGIAMGATSFRNGMGHGFLQVLSSGIKVPVLYVLSVLVCYPVLYFVILLMGSRLSFMQTLMLILMALILNSILLAGCAPIVLFFTFTGSSYEFIKLLHVVIFVFSGAWAMQALWHGLTAMCEKSDLYPRQAIRILQIWVLVFGFVGTQMAWSLRPYVGSPEREFQIVRTTQDGNFYQMIWRSLVGLTRENSSISERLDD